MHGHISYVSQKLGEYERNSITSDVAASLRSMRTMLIRGLESAADYSERASRLSLVRKIDVYLQQEWRNAS